MFKDSALCLLTTETVMECGLNPKERLGPGTLRGSACAWTHLSSSNKTQRNYGTKNNCMHVQWGQILDQKIQRDRKIQLPLLRSLKQKQGPVHVPCTQHHLRDEETT